MSSKSIVWFVTAAALIAALLLWRAAPTPVVPAAPTPVTPAVVTAPATGSLPPVVMPAEPPPPAAPPARVSAAATPASEPRRPLAPGVVAIQDQKTLDFSSGKAVVKDDAAEKAAIEAALKEIEEATQGVTFGPNGGPVQVK